MKYMSFLKSSATCQGSKIGLKGMQYGLNATIALLVLTGIGSGLVNHNPKQDFDQSTSASISESQNLTASREITTVSAVTLVPTAQISGNQYKTTIWLNMRSGAGFNYSVIGSGVTGTKVTATGKVSGVWYQVKMGTKTGWMSSEYLSKVSVTPTPVTPKPAPTSTSAGAGIQYATTIWLNMRSGAGFNSSVIGAGPTGTKVTATGKSNGVWLEVKMGNLIGWMSSDYLRAVTGPTSSTELKAFAASKLGNAQQAQCLNTLWERESNWNYRAINPAFSPRQANIPEYQAYGIAQAAPGSKMATAGADWKTNPRTQITWGISYIKGRYGNPCSALTFHTIRGWY
jgi:uncharacterized protein YgiM (DUF1202 family)